MRISDWSSDVCSSDLDAVGQPGLGVDLRQLQRAERGQLGRLEDHGIAAGQRRRRLPAGHLDRVVTGADAGPDAEALAARVEEDAAASAITAVRDRKRFEYGNSVSGSVTVWGSA